MDFRNINNGEDFVFYRQGYIHEITRAIQTISSLSPSAGVQELESEFVLAVINPKLISLIKYFKVLNFLRHFIGCHVFI